MTFINDIIKRLFPDQKANISHRENIAQSVEEEQNIKEWMHSEEGKNSFGKIYKNYHLKKAGIKDNPEVHILSTPYANGFAITFESPITEEIFSNLFFAFGNRMLDLGYYRVSLDRRLVEEADLVKTTERQYFKSPSRPGMSKKMDQLFGNVNIERVLMDNKPVFLKVLVTVYSDHLYLKAQSFDQFIEELFAN